MNTTEFLAKSESFFRDLNNWLDKNNVLDELFPDHDGVADAESSANLYALRDRLQSIANGMSMAMQKVSEAIELMEESNNDKK